MSRIFFYIFSFFLFFLIALFSFLDFFLPSYLESEFFPEIAGGFGVSGFSCRVRKTGFFGSDLGSIKIWNKVDPSFTVESVRVDYSPSGLLKKRIKKISFTGIKLFCQYKDGNFKIKGLDIKDILAKIPSKKEEPSVSAKPFVFPVEKIEIRDGVIICAVNGKKYRLPVDFELFSGNQEKNLIICTISLYPRGESIIFSAIIDPLDNKIRLTFNGDSMELGRYADLVNLISDSVILRGRGDFSGTADLQMDPFKISSFSARARFLEGNILYRNFQIHNPENKENEKKCVEMKITGRGGEKWNISLSPFKIVSPVPVVISGFRGFFQPLDKSFEAGADFTVTMEKNEDYLGINGFTFAPSPLQMAAFAAMGKKGEWSFKLSNKSCENNRWNIKTRGFDIIFNEPFINLAGDGKSSSGSIKYDLGVKNIYGTGESGDIRVSDLSAAGKVKKDKLNPFCFNGIIKIDNCSIKDSKGNVNLLGIKGNIPLKWPCEKFGEKGELRVKEVKFKNLKAGSVLASVRQKNGTLFFKGEHKNSLVNDLLMKFSGYSGISSSGNFNTKIDFNLEHKYGAEDINIRRFVSSQKDIIVNGDLDVKGGIAIDETGLNCFLAGTLYNGKFLMGDNAISMEGISASCTIPELINMRSSGLQRFSFDRASFGKTELANGEIIFNIESGDSIFIEKISAEYCRGKVFTHAIRISSGKSDYNLIFFFDRLNLAMILENLGIEKSEGEGALNGRLPVMFNNGQIIFGDGFLYSTPGVGGNIRLTGTQVLTSGIPEGTVQHAQLELAREALKDYKYEWVKLSLVTKGENLLLKMQLAGKPAGPLPFVYKKDFGGFVKIEGKGEGSVFQGIGIDVNFKLPLNRLMKYNKNINSLFDLIRKPGE